jgi:hypothetical protein
LECAAEGEGLAGVRGSGGGWWLHSFWRGRRMEGVRRRERCARGEEGLAKAAAGGLGGGKVRVGGGRNGKSRSCQ